MPEKNRLITNISFIQIGDIRIWANALLLEYDEDPPGKSIFGVTKRVRGFKTDGALNVFDKFMKCNPFDYQIIKAAGRDAFMGGDEPPKPIFSGGMILFADGTEIYANTEDRNFDFDIFDHSDICVIWDELAKRTAKYWQAPNMPQALFRSADLVRRVLES